MRSINQAGILGLSHHAAYGRGVWRGGIRAAFKANEAFQKRMRDSGVKDHIPTKIVTLKVRLGDGEHVNPSVHLFQEGEKSGQG
jgi:hypothetical protein